jgi:hypothetical protein
MYNLPEQPEVQKFRTSEVPHFGAGCEWLSQTLYAPTARVSALFLPKVTERRVIVASVAASATVFERLTAGGLAAMGEGAALPALERC